MAQAGIAFVDVVGKFDVLNTGVESALASLSKKLGDFGTTAFKGFGIGVAAAGAIGFALFKVGEDFSNAEGIIRAGTGATGASLAGLEKSFKSVVSTVPTDFGSAATAVTQLHDKLGLTGEPLQALSEQLLTLSRITKTDLTGNIDAATAALNNWSIPVKDQPARLDELFRASQRSGIGFADLSTQMATGGAVLRTAGLSFDEAAGFIALLSKNGISATPVFMGVAAAIKAAAKEGVPADQVFRSMFEGIRNAPNDTAAAGLAISDFGARAGPKLAPLIRSGQLSYEQFAAALSKGDTIRGAGDATQTLGDKFELMKNKVMVAIEPLASGVFAAAGAAMLALGQAVADTIGWFEKHKTVAEALAVAIGLVIASLIAIKVALAITSLVQTLTVGFVALGAALTGDAAGGIALLTGKLAGLAGAAAPAAASAGEGQLAFEGMGAGAATGSIGLAGLAAVALPVAAVVGTVAVAAIGLRAGLSAAGLMGASLGEQLAGQMPKLQAYANVTDFLNGKLKETPQAAMAAAVKLDELTHSGTKYADALQRSAVYQQGQVDEFQAQQTASQNLAIAEGNVASGVDNYNQVVAQSGPFSLQAAGAQAELHAQVDTVSASAKLAYDALMKQTGGHITAAGGAQAQIAALQILATQFPPLAGYINGLITQLQGVGAQHPNPAVSVNDQASAPIAWLSKSLDNMNGRVATVTLNTVLGGVASALNMALFGHTATGGVFDIPQLRVFAEGGKPEAVLPLTDKARSMEILRSTDLFSQEGGALVGVTGESAAPVVTPVQPAASDKASGTTITGGLNITAQTNADSHDIASEVGWTLRTVR